MAIGLSGAWSCCLAADRGGRLFSVLQRTREIQTAIPEVSPKMMTQALRGMERDGLVVREVHSTGSRHVEYSLTPMGTSLIPPLQELCRWAKANVRRRDQARERFDQLLNMKS